jgi:hypothetical protein
MMIDEARGEVGMEALSPEDLARLEQLRDKSKPPAAVTTDPAGAPTP